MLTDLARIKKAQTRRISSWDVAGRNHDWWRVKPGESKILADIKGPGCITHIWMTQPNHYRECVLKVYYEDNPYPSIDVPLGDFFGLGHGIVNSYQSLLFTASTNHNNKFNLGCALNSYIQLPFRQRAVIELTNESQEDHGQYFYIDYETYGPDLEQDLGYLHAEFRRENPFGGWAGDIPVNVEEANIANKEHEAWENNYVILDTKNRGHYIGCNLSVANFQGQWWGEGDDMIWVDGYKWPPDLHGTGSEDYLNQAWGMQDNAFLRNGSSIYENNTRPTPGGWQQHCGGYQTSYVFHLENPIRFEKEIKVTIEHGHGNHLRNDMSSVAYWYGEKPTQVHKILPVAQRKPVRLDTQGNWIFEAENQSTSGEIVLNDEMKALRKQWDAKQQTK